MVDAKIHTEGQILLNFERIWKELYPKEIYTFHLVLMKDVNYISSPSLNSVLSKHEEDIANVGEIANEPIIVEAIVQCEPSEPIFVEENTEVHSV